MYINVTIHTLQNVSSDIVFIRLIYNILLNFLSITTANFDNHSMGFRYRWAFLWQA